MPIAREVYPLRAVSERDVCDLARSSIGQAAYVEQVKIVVHIVGDPELLLVRRKCNAMALSGGQSRPLIRRHRKAFDLNGVELRTSVDAPDLEAGEKVDGDECQRLVPVDRAWP